MVDDVFLHFSQSKKPHLQPKISWKEIESLPQTMIS